MQEIKITDLDAAGTLDGTEITVVVKAGVTKQSTTQEIADLFEQTGASGSFTTVDNKTVTVVNGVITTIV